MKNKPFFLEEEYLEECVIVENFGNGRIMEREDNIARIAESYRKEDPSIPEEDSIKMACDLLDPGHEIMMEEIINGPEDGPEGPGTVF